MARAIAKEGCELSGVAGEASAAAAFAGAWGEHKAVAVEVAEAQRLYVLGSFVPPAAVPGRLRRAEMAEHAMIVTLFSQFQLDTGSIHFDVSGAVDSGLSSGRLFVWDDDGVRCIARATEPLGGVSRIGLVYTPGPWRRRGYAAACVGALCERERAEEGANTVLYAQLRNPGSNAIYRRLGFQAVSEVLSYDFGKVIENR
jgi:predicted GNAT family acetyltransferase